METIEHTFFLFCIEPDENGRAACTHRKKRYFILEIKPLQRIYHASTMEVPAPRLGATNADLQLKRSEATREYEVAEIIKQRLTKSGVTEYRIRWSGFSPNADTWEPETNLNCGELLAEFHLKNAVNPPVELPIPNLRKSKRAKNAVQRLVYSHTARCAFCDMQLPICEDEDDLSFCTAKCMQKFQNGGKEILRTSQTESHTISREKSNRTEAVAAESRQAENSVVSEEIPRTSHTENDTNSHEKLNRRIPNLISVDNHLPRMFEALPQPQPIRVSPFHAFQPFEMSSANENGSISQDSCSQLLQRIPANYPLQAPHEMGYNQLVSGGQFAANYLPQAPRGIVFNQPVSNSRFSPYAHGIGYSQPVSSSAFAANYPLQAPYGIGYNQPVSSSRFSPHERSAFAANYAPQTTQPGAGFNPQHTQPADGSAAIQDSGNQSPTDRISNQENRVPNMLTDPYGFINYFRTQ